MRNLSNGQLKLIRNLVSLAGIALGFYLWLLLPDVFKNTNFFHVGSGEYGSKIWALILVFLPLISFIPTDNTIEDIHTDAPEERRLLEEKRQRKLLTLQAQRAIALTLLVAIIMAIALLQQ